MCKVNNIILIIVLLASRRALQFSFIDRWLDRGTQYGEVGTNNCLALWRHWYWRRSKTWLYYSARFTLYCILFGSKWSGSRHVLRLSLSRNVLLRRHFTTRVGECWPCVQRICLSDSVSDCLSVCLCVCLCMCCVDKTKSCSGDISCSAGKARNKEKILKKRQKTAQNYSEHQ